MELDTHDDLVDAFLSDLEDSDYFLGQLEAQTGDSYDHTRDTSVEAFMDAAGITMTDVWAESARGGSDIAYPGMAYMGDDGTMWPVYPDDDNDE